MEKRKASAPHSKTGLDSVAVAFCQELKRSPSSRWSTMLAGRADIFQFLRALDVLEEDIDDVDTDDVDTCSVVTAKNMIQYGEPVPQCRSDQD